MGPAVLSDVAAGALAPLHDLGSFSSPPEAPARPRLRPPLAAPRLPTSLAVGQGSLEEPIEGGSTHIPVMTAALKDLNAFNQAWNQFNSQKKGVLPEAMYELWTKFYGHKDRLGKIKDFLRECHRKEQALVGPRPEDANSPEARMLMENSVSANINVVAEESGLLGAQVDRAISTVSGPRGLAEQVNELVEKLASAKAKITSITTGDIPDADLLNGQAKTSFAPLPPEFVFLLPARPRRPGRRISRAEPFL